MGISLNLDNWCRTNGYTLTKGGANKVGDVIAVYTDYDVWLKVKVKQKIAGIQIDSKSKNYYLGSLKSFLISNVVDTVVKKTVTVRRGGGDVYYDDTLEDKLGGDKQLMGV